MRRPRLLILASSLAMLGWGSVLPYQYAYAANTRGWGNLVAAAASSLFSVGALFALLSGQHASAGLDIEANERIAAAAHFVVGGVAQTLSAWLVDDLRVTAAQLAIQLGTLIDQLADPRLYTEDG